MRKIINSETRKYEENVTDTLVLDAVPTVNSFNSVTSDGVARAIAGASGEVPVVTEDDNGKVLTAIYDEGGPAVEWAEPAVDQTYDAESTNAQSGVAVAGALAEVNQVPASTSSDEGKVLTVDAQGVPGWATPAVPSGGSDEWWGGDPGSDVSGPDGTVRLRFKDTTYDPRNDPDSTFLARFSSITKVSDGVYDFACKNLQSSIFQNKYLADNEFVVLRFRLGGVDSVLCVSIFYGCTGLRAVYNVDDTGSGRSWAFAFYGCTNLVDVRLGFLPDSLGMRFKATSVKEMFENCYRLKTLKAEIVGSGVDCDRMCRNCYALEIGPTLRAVASKTSMMFEGCRCLVRFLSPDVADSTTYVSTHGVACNDMFDGCTSLQSLDGLCLFFAGSFISNASSMFAGCSALTKAPYIRLESSAVCRSMFNGCTVLERPPRMDWANISDMWRMFSKCQSMTTLDDGSSWYSYQLNSDLTDVHEMFYKCIGVRDQSPEFVYQALSQVATTYNDCFTDCGIVWNNPSLANIPASWGGTGA